MMFVIYNWKKILRAKRRLELEGEGYYPTSAIGNVYVVLKVDCFTILYVRRKCILVCLSCYNSIIINQKFYFVMSYWNIA